MSRVLANDPIDWALDDQNDLIFPLRYTRGAAAVAQGMRIRLGMVRGEWFLNLDYGMPWLENDIVPEGQAILGGKFVIALTRAEVRKQILLTPGVLEVTALDASFDDASRTMTVSYTVATSFGDTVSDSLTMEF